MLLTQGVILAQQEFGDGWIRLVIIATFIGFWILGQILTATRRKNPEEQPQQGLPPELQQQDFPPDVLLEIEQAKRQRQTQRGAERDSGRGASNGHATQGTVVVQPQETRRQRQLRERQERDRLERERRHREQVEQARQIRRQPMPRTPVFPGPPPVVESSAYDIEAPREKPVFVSKDSSKQSVHAFSSKAEQQKAEGVRPAVRLRAAMIGPTLKDAILLNEVLGKPKALRDV